MDKLALSNLLDEKIDDVIKWMEMQDEAAFGKTYHEDKWTVGQHIQHLIITNRAVLNGLKMPKLILRWKFGKCNRVERSYEETIDKYYTVLNGKKVKAPKQYDPRSIEASEKSLKLDQLVGLKNQTKKILNKWSENQMSKYVLPHPAVGKLTIREFIYFIALHTEHHLNILKKDYHSI